MRENLFHKGFIDHACMGWMGVGFHGHKPYKVFVSVKVVNKTSGKNLQGFPVREVLKLWFEFLNPCEK